LQRKKGRGCLFVVSGPSGAGKTTLYQKVASTLPDLKHSVSYTTRPPRQEEVHDWDYTFISRDEFRAMVERGEFIEWAEVYGDLYGTSKKRLEEITDSGTDIILDIDTQGAMQLRRKFSDGVYIFVLPPSLGVLKERLAKRMAGTPEEVEKRFHMAAKETQYYHEYDYVIINNEFEDALKELEAIILSHRVRTGKVDTLWIKENFLQ